MKDKIRPSVRDTAQQHGFGSPESRDAFMSRQLRFSTTDRRMRRGVAIVLATVIPAVAGVAYYFGYNSDHHSNEPKPTPGVSTTDGPDHTPSPHKTNVRR